jgi:1,4-alpha-glucan branching enzyme
VQYSTNRFKAHINRFNLLAMALENGDINEKLLTEIENRDNIFAEINYRIYQS